MISRNAIIAIVVLASTAAFSQSSAAALSQSGQPGTTAAAPILDRQPMMPRRAPAGNKPAELQGTVALRERVGDMEKTLTAMHAGLRRMRAKTGKSGAADPLTKANLEMWQLMIGDLDQELAQLRLALASREDMEARRIALYKQAEDKAAAQAQIERAAQAAKFAEAAQKVSGTQTSASPAQGTQQNPSSPGPAHPSTPPTSDNSGSRN